MGCRYCYRAKADIFSNGEKIEWLCNKSHRKQWFPTHQTTHCDYIEGHRERCPDYKEENYE